MSEWGREGRTEGGRERERERPRKASERDAADTACSTRPTSPAVKLVVK